MINGFSILLPTYNMLPWLKTCIDSIRRNSKLNNQICIHVDGSTDGTIEWLSEKGILFTAGNHKGMYSAWNRAAEQAKKKYLFQGEDDLFFCPGWDINLAKWLEDVKDTIIVSRLIEPFRGSFLPVVDCGRTPETFDEEKLLAWASANAKHELIKQAFGLWAMPADLWEEIGGYDEAYDPAGYGNGDMKMKLCKAGIKRFRRAEDVLMYHFKPQPDVIPYQVDHSNLPKNLVHFMEKWGIHPSKASELWLKE